MKLYFINKFFKNIPLFTQVDSISHSSPIRIVTVFMLFLLVLIACNRQNVWENEYQNYGLVPDVTLTSINATSCPSSLITIAWIDPTVTGLNHIQITCTDVSTSTVVDTASIVSGIQTYTTPAFSLCTEYRFNIRSIDNFGNMSPGADFSITPQAAAITGHFIYTVQDLDAVHGTSLDPKYAGWGLGSTYFLMADLDLDIAPYNTGEGWVPIGTFTGKFEGNGHTIRNLMINKPTIYSGLFGRVNGGIIRNVNLVNINVSGTQYVGGLIAYNENSGSVYGCSVTGTVAGSADSIGGLIGFNLNCNISSSYSEVTVTGMSNYIGGLIGSNNAGSIDNSYSVCNVSATAASTNSIGGLIGYNTGNINGCYSRGSVTATLPTINSVGGLIGSSLNSNISNSFSEVNISGSGNNIGGFIGFLANNIGATITLDYCHATGSVTGGNYTGGLIGYNRNVITGTINLQNNCYSTGSVTGTSYTGGLVGWNSNETTGTISINYCYSSVAIGNVSGTTCVGGLIGYNTKGIISHCYSSNYVSGTGLNIGGLVGYNDNGGGGTVYAIIEYSFVTGNVLSTSSNVGGLVGNNYFGFISCCSSIGQVEGVTSVGGLVGYTTSTAGINESYTTGNVTSSTGIAIGGLVGRNWSGPIIYSYSKGNVTGATTDVGGIVGNFNGGSLTFSYALGIVSPTAATCGGLIGSFSSGTIGDSYFNEVNIGNSIGFSSSLTNLQIQSTYTGWDFATIWNIGALNNGYPYLRNNLP